MLGRTLAVVCLLVVAGCAGFPGGASTPTATTDAGNATQVFVEDEDGTELGNVTVEVADTRDERYTGLSEHESLGPNEGMLFVYDREGSHAYVMRSMDFPIDIVYVGANGRITRIHHAPVEADNEDLTRYRGVGKWALEVPYNWTTERGVEVGDRVRIED
ncbi:DUF192 domain-containing protein [Halobacterium sp. CBA1126]|uniref:DUF192 domain-containing protein n=1 Tax=Halobacterium sp. CBA1126 TaxID=2668074 RepID=UPI0012FAF222|nr:DUF192 domain-containing protein [Halobacterium sp. CBA1126]MUV60672.1 DUF192 domain-containing protein [Halobacterium sp. CBA1126]